MTTPYDELIGFLTEHGLSQDEADHAARQCARSMAVHAVGAYAAGGAIAYFMAMNPLASIPFLAVTASAGAGYALLESPGCGDIREAVRFWWTASP